MRHGNKEKLTCTLDLLFCTGLMLLGCGMMTTSVPTMITAGITGTLPGASDCRSTTGAWGQQHERIGRVLLADSGAEAISGTASHHFAACSVLAYCSVSRLRFYPVSQLRWSSLETGLQSQSFQHLVCIWLLSKSQLEGIAFQR